MGLIASAMASIFTTKYVFGGSTEITAGLGGKLYVETLCFVSSKKSLCVV